jgi:cyclase
VARSTRAALRRIPAEPIVPAMRALLLWASLSSGVALAEDLSKVEVTVQKIAPGLAMLQGDGGNIGVSYGDDGVFLIDDELAPLHAKIKAAIATLSKQPVRYVFNTHWHYDHTGDNANMGTEGATIVAHDNVFQRLSTPQQRPMSAAMMPAEPHAALPVITFDRELTFHLNGDTAHVLHVEHAHTDGDSIVFFAKADVVHMGDTLFSDGYPFIDARSGGSIDGMIRADERVIAMIDERTRVIPGHGPLANKARLVEFHDMLKAVRDQVAALKRKKLTVEQVIAAKPTASYDAAWGHEFPPADFVRDVYTTLGGK